MLLIALSGGLPAERLAIADHLVTSGKARLAAYAQATPRADFGVARARILSEALSGLEGRRALAGGLVVVHCLSAEEAQLVRAQGGVLWHVHGSVTSGSVPIRREDVMVTDGQAGYAHVQAPLEALSELLLAQGLGKRATTLG